ncbi:hypothetical protein EVAR_40712_1 [Eumeta japonica]|uniref:Uncharacterized protein n=1 Tax=Eumeta variegata TaxID=151549 RepID=A0A4C1X688_EUMVA|nr:hypothetical protein EVAR_40712_1 [Eumeta japonica]
MLINVKRNDINYRPLGQNRPRRPATDDRAGRAARPLDTLYNDQSGVTHFVEQHLYSRRHLFGNFMYTSRCDLPYKLNLFAYKQTSHIGDPHGAWARGRVSAPREHYFRRAACGHWKILRAILGRPTNAAASARRRRLRAARRLTAAAPVRDKVSASARYRRGHFLVRTGISYIDLVSPDRSEKGDHVRRYHGENNIVTVKNIE